MLFSKLARRAFGPWHPSARLPVWYDPAYRLPLARHEPRAGIELRRADLVAWYLQQRRVLARGAWRLPSRVSYGDLARVHEPAWLESLADPDVLARVFAVAPEEIIVDSLLESVRLAAGGTLAATREALARRGPTLNLLGGFHHAFPGRGGGFCAVNDVAVAVAVVRAEGFAGQVCVVDLDAHPPDGTAACLLGDSPARDAKVWIGSLSAAQWDDLPAGVDETVLAVGAGDAVYLAALDALLARMPRPELCFVLAGGDVLAGDPLGRLGLSLGGVRERDRSVARALANAGAASVWLPGGGYHDDAWKVLAGTALVLAGLGTRPIAEHVDPMDERFVRVSDHLAPERLRGGKKAAAAAADDWRLSAEDVEDILGVQRAAPRRLLGYYSIEGLEYAMHAYGLLAHVERLGYRELRVELDEASSGGDRARLFGSSGGEEHLLIECALERKWLAAPIDAEVLYVHWLTLRDPRATFRDGRAALPGQEVPGLGVAREIILMLERMAHRLGLRALAYRPAWYHTAYPARHLGRFAEPGRQGRFEAMLRDFGEQDSPAAAPAAAADPAPVRRIEVAAASRAMAEGRVRRNGERYDWEPDVMVRWLEGAAPDDASDIARARAASRFEMV